MTIIPGWNPSPFQGVFTPVSFNSLVKQAHSTAITGGTITAPADIIAGDLLMIADSCGGLYSAPALVTPSGFTNRSNVTTGSQRMAVFTKLATGSEASTVYTGMADPVFDSVAKIFLVFRPNVALGSLTTGTWGGQATTADPTSQTVTISAISTPVVAIGVYCALAAVDPRTMTAAKDAEVSAINAVATNLWVAWKIYNSSPSNVSVDMADEGSNFLSSGYLTGSP